LAGIGDGYRVLFLQGGASLQFTMVPMNLLPKDRTADYLVTGVWSEKAVIEARRFGGVHEAVSAAGTRFDRIPALADIRYSANPAYVHLTTNNTIYGTQWTTEPPVPAGVPLVADTSSDMFSRPLDIEKYGLIYAGAQKNLGPSGLALVIMRKDLLDRCPESVNIFLRYKTHAEEASLYNTPNTWAVYVLKLVTDWVQSLGGVAGMQRINEKKAATLYSVIDSSGFWKCPVAKEDRSIMNVVWRLPSEELEEAFVGEAKKAGLVGLKGHRSVGGIRASIYNAVGQDAVDALVSFMKDFKAKNG